MAFRLQTLLDLKRRAEDDAEKAVAAAIAERAKAEVHQGELEAAVVRAQQTLRDARAKTEVSGRGDEALARERFRLRLADDVKTRTECARVHRAGPLADAQAAEETARALHLEARREREALEKHKEKEMARDKQVAERRSEDAQSDLAIAAHFKKLR